MSYKAEVVADSSGKWNTNALRFATEQEAEEYGKDLFRRWTLVTDRRVMESDDPANYKWDYEKQMAVRLGDD